MRDFIITTLLILSSINSVVSATEDDVFVIEIEGHYRMEAGTPVRLAKKMAYRDDLSEPSGKKILELGRDTYGESPELLHSTRAGVYEKSVESGLPSGSSNCVR